MRGCAVWRSCRLSPRALQPRFSWFALGPDNFSGRILAMDFHPSGSPMYVGACDGGVWRSSDDGASWEPLTDDLLSLAIGGLAVSKTDPDIVVIGTGEGTPNVAAIGGIGILRSTDAGATWDPTNVTYALGTGLQFHHVEAGPSGTFLAGSTDGLWRSSDDGATWTEILDVGDFYDVKWRPGSADTVYCVKGNASIGNNVKISTDDGLTWTKAGGGAGGQPASGFIGKSKLAVSAADPDVVYALFANSAGTGLTGLYRTTDAGTTWTPQNTTGGLVGGQVWYNLALTADPNNADWVLAGGVDLLRSTNGGVNFSSVDAGVHVDHHVLRYVPGSTSSVWVGNDGGVYRSDSDGGNFTWLDYNNGLQTYQFYDICVNNGPAPYYIMGGTQDNGTDRWTGTTNWSEGLGADGMVCNIDYVLGTIVYATIQQGGHRKNLTAGSGVWMPIMNGITGFGSWVTPRDLDPNDGNHLYTSSTDGIFRTTDGGANWTNVAPHTARWISISPVDGDVVWTVGGGRPWLTTDDGATWAQTAAYGFAEGNGGEWKVHAHPTDVATAWVIFSSFSPTLAKVALTTDSGASWTNVSGDLPGLPVNGFVANPSNPAQWFAATDVGVWYTEDGGADWIPFGTGLPNAVGIDVEIQDELQKLVLGSFGRGAWEIDIPTAGQVDAPEVAAGPLHLMLDAPYPNPVADRTMFRFAARSEGTVSLEVFDVRGRRVASVSEQSRGDGIVKTAPWFVDDVPSGVYFAVLRTGEESVSRKVVVAR